ncbi:MAG: hypothetical protein Q4E88_05160 [Coriobacteriia bacterium]|nr:hypothetical protein [Coriobacteriia bacterium]
MKDISRRSFIFGGGAAAIGAGIALSGCGFQKATNQDFTNSRADICAGVAYSTNDFNPIGNSNALTLALGWHVF